MHQMRAVNMSSAPRQIIEACGCHASGHALFPAEKEETHSTRGEW